MSNSSRKFKRQFQGVEYVERISYREARKRGAKCLMGILAALALIVALAFVCVPAQAQSTSNTFNVFSFRLVAATQTVGDMTVAAQNQCSPNTAYPCIIIFDPVLSQFPLGNMPSKCAQCIWLDYRTPFSPVSTNGNNGFTGINTACNLNGVITVDGICYAKTDAGIQAAYNAASDGTTIFLPSGTYTACNSLPISMTGNKRVNLVGEGWNSVIQVCAGASASTDVIFIQPPNGSTLQGVRLQDFAITHASGTPGRYGINIDGTNAALGYLTVNHIFIDTLGNYALAVTNATGLTTGTPYVSQIRDSYFSGGLNCNGCGDSLNIEDNTFVGPRDINVTVAQIGHSGTQGGAHAFNFYNNNVTVLGGMVIVNAWQGCICFNNFEMTGPSTEVNNALIDVQGNTVPGPIQNLKIWGNYLGANNLYVADTVRVDRAVGTEIDYNLTSQGSGVVYRITANADRTHFTYNRLGPDNVLSSVLDDLGTHTLGEFIQQATGLRTFYNVTCTTSAAGVTGTCMSNTQFKINPTNGVFCGSSGDPSATACDTFFSRVTTNEWGFGSAFGLSDGTIDVRNIKVTGSTSGVDVIQAPAVAGAGTLLLAAGTAGATIPASFTTTAATTDNVTVTGMTSSGHCVLEPTNSAAAAGIASVFVSAKAANQITVTHTATSGWTFDIHCTPN